MAAPICPACGTPARLRLGADACPDRLDLADAPVWACAFCEDTWAECCPGTETAIAPPADAGLREARALLIARRIEPILRGVEHPSLARDRLRGFLACRMGIERPACDPRRFTVEECRAAWEALSGVSYADVRVWAATWRGPVQVRPLAPADPLAIGAAT